MNYFFILLFFINATLLYAGDFDIENVPVKVFYQKFSKRIIDKNNEIKNKKYIVDSFCKDNQYKNFIDDKYLKIEKKASIISWLFEEKPQSATIIENLNYITYVIHDTISICKTTFLQKKGFQVCSSFLFGYLSEEKDFYPYHNINISVQYFKKNNLYSPKIMIEKVLQNINLENDLDNEFDDENSRKALYVHLLHHYICLHLDICNTEREAEKEAIITFFQKQYGHGDDKLSVFKFFLKNIFLQDIVEVNEINIQFFDDLISPKIMYEFLLTNKDTFEKTYLYLCKICYENEDLKNSVIDLLNNIFKKENGKILDSYLTAFLIDKYVNDYEEIKKINFNEKIEFLLKQYYLYHTTSCIRDVNKEPSSKKLQKNDTFLKKKIVCGFSLLMIFGVLIYGYCNLNTTDDIKNIKEENNTDNADLQNEVIIKNYSSV